MNGSAVTGSRGIAVVLLTVLWVFGGALGGGAASGEATQAQAAPPPAGQPEAASAMQSLWESTLLVENGRIDAIAYLGEGVVLLGSRQPNPGRLFRSTDYGQTWRELPREGRALPEGNITCIWPGRKNDVYLCTGDAHVWKSEDAGLTWTSRGKVSRNANSEGAQLAYGMMVLPTGTVLLSDTNTPGGHIYRSVDEGRTWSDLGAVSSRALYRFQQAGAGVIVNGWAGHVYRSADDGLTWADPGQLLDSELFATEALSADVLLQGSASGHVLRSADAGRTWKDLGKIGDAADDFAYLGDGVVLYSTYAGDKQVFLSKDHGLTWAGIGSVATVPGDVLDHVVCVPDAQDDPTAVGGTVNGYVVRVSRNKLGAFTAPSASSTTR